MKRNLVIILFLISLLLITGCSNNQVTGQAIKDTATSTQSNCKYVEVPYEEQEEYLKTEYYTETVPEAIEECNDIELVYSVTDFKQIEGDCLKQEDKCKKYFLGICTEKETYCTKKYYYCGMNTNNLDEDKGTWDYKLNLYGNNEWKEAYSNTIFLYPKTSTKDNIIANSYNWEVGILTAFQIEGKEDNAKRYSCNYEITRVPTKSVCKTKTVYRDVQREKQITAYRPVTKYKTEKQCN